MMKEIKSTITRFNSYYRGGLILLLCLLWTGFAFGQQLNTGGHPKAEEKKEEPITDYKVISQETAPDGRIIKKVQYKKGNVVIRETTIMPAMPKLSSRGKLDVSNMDLDSILILVEKQNYLVAVIYKRKRIRQYRAVFGPDPFHDKYQEGDQMTPEGWFTVKSKRYHSNWQRFILLDYPNETSWQRFRERQRKGEIPKNARIGGAIGIHGTYPSGAEMVDLGIGWTEGCVALKPKDVEDLYQFIKPGTRVYIRR